MDRIAIKGIKAHGNHGVLEEEQSLGQHFIVDIYLYLDVTVAAANDDLEATINYADIFDIVQQQICDNSYKLIETLAYKIICRCFKYDQRIKKIKVKVKKPQAPLVGEFRWAEVSMKRSRHECNLS